jgi:hypothetical protein
MADLVAEQTGAGTNALLKRTPFVAMVSIFGVASALILSP